MKKRQVKFFKGDQVRLKKGCSIEGIDPDNIVKVFDINYGVEDVAIYICSSEDVTIYIYTRQPGHNNYRRTGKMTMSLSDFEKKFRKARKDEKR